MGSGQGEQVQCRQSSGKQLPGRTGERSEPGEGWEHLCLALTRETGSK